VREGDTLERIAKMFEVTVNTVRWTNNLDRKAVLKVGQELTILPISGIPYTVKRGDTLASIAKATGGDAEEIALFNDISGSLAAGTALIIPDGELSTPAPAPAPRRNVATGVRPVGTTGGVDSSGYYLAPLSRYVRTQGIHGYNSVDLGAPVGTPILASASGEVILSRTGSWNGGYGNYVVISHDNGSQTLYAHQSRVAVGVGEHVVKGQVIGYVGNTGRSTGPHLHFEIRGGPRNPFGK
jgi:murein DD-endopeptidase MepM/ murein hydrolase activator NlpD